MTDPLTRTMTPDYASELFRAARAKERVTLAGWIRSHLRWQANNFGANQDQGFNSQVMRRESSDGSLAAWCTVKSTSSFRPGTTPAPNTALCVSAALGIAAQVERQGGANSEDAQ